MTFQDFYDLVKATAQSEGWKDAEAVLRMLQYAIRFDGKLDEPDAPPMMQIAFMAINDEEVPLRRRLGPILQLIDGQQLADAIHGVYTPPMPFQHFRDLIKTTAATEGWEDTEQILAAFADAANYDAEFADDPRGDYHLAFAVQGMDNVGFSLHERAILIAEILQVKQDDDRRSGRLPSEN